MKRDPTIDPRTGDKVEHKDGGEMWVLGRKGLRTKLVLVARNPDLWSKNKWVRLEEFQRDARGLTE